MVYPTQDVGVSEDAGVVRNGVRLASKQASSERTQGKLESGARLQFAQFVHALTYVAEHKRVALDSVLFRVSAEVEASLLPGKTVSWRHQSPINIKIYI